MKLELSVENQRIEINEELRINNMPENLEAGKFYKFEMRGYHIFPINKPILLRCDNEILASIDIVSVCNYLSGRLVHSKIGYYVRRINKRGKNDKTIPKSC